MPVIWVTKVVNKSHFYADKKLLQIMRIILNFETIYNSFISTFVDLRVVSSHTLK